MAKGNHVFNDFDGCIASAFADVLAKMGGEGGAHLRALNGSGGPVAPARTFMDSKFTRSYPSLLVIRSNPRIAEIHWVQDDAVVAANDENSGAFGEAAAAFRSAVVDWAMGGDCDNPMAAWRQLVNAGVDHAAMERFVAGSSQSLAPRSAEGRRTLCLEIEKFIRGALTKDTAKWLIELRLDLQLQNYDYAKSESGWKATLGKGLGPGWFAPASGAG